MKDLFQVDYDQLATIATCFSQQSERMAIRIQSPLVSFVNTIKSKPPCSALTNAPKADNAQFVSQRHFVEQQVIAPAS